MSIESLRGLFRRKQQTQEERLASLIDRALAGETIDEDKLATIVDELGVDLATFEAAVANAGEKQRQDARQSQRQALIDEFPRLKDEQRALAREREEFNAKLEKNRLTMQREADDLKQREDQLRARLARCQAAKDNIVRGDY